jgi:hypothetical protein
MRPTNSLSMVIEESFGMGVPKCTEEENGEQLDKDEASSLF